MKAVVYHEYGSPDVLSLQEIDKPAPKQDEALVHVRAASANPADWHYLRGVPYVMRPQAGLRRPKNAVLGRDIAGEVEAVGPSVTEFRPGDEVFAEVETGGFAEYACVAEKWLVPKPANLTFEEAAAVPLAGLTALQGLRDAGRLQPEQKVLIIGSAGGVGTFAVQLAKHFDAHVTGVCSTTKVDLVRSLGADAVVDYTEGDFTQSGQRYDLIFQLAGTASPSDLRRALTSKGTLVLSSGESDGRWLGPVDRLIKAAALSPFVSQKLGSFLARRNKDDLRLLKELIEAGQVKPVIDRTYSLAEVPVAIRYLEEGHAEGKVVITV
jgi:NADPH:quinone reductase-like Zn-dependent oxidoreductase